MILNKIVEYKKERIKDEKARMSLKTLIKRLYLTEPSRDFKESFTDNKLSIIGEIKKASPSKGIIKEDFCPRQIARIYDENKVDAISVLTEDKFFKGSNLYLKQVRKVTNLPILRKDFIIDSFQIYQSKVLGTDAILLISTILTKRQLTDFQKIAKVLGLCCLVEVHNKEELDIVLETDAEIIGINNRNLRDFTTDIRNTEDLIKFIPNNKIVISESGINSQKDMDYLKSLGVSGVLIGESLMKAQCIGEKLRELRGEVAVWK
ncbi:MAG: indole-3-glycerol phosphate synthase TrpC [Alkaliphilus sp.]|nr:indole-3-glycerol phosphate synthase TrpC [Alkaliphilus sp.]